MPQQRKTSDRRVDRHRSRANLELAGDAGQLTEIPPAPPGLLKTTKLAWESYWRSPMTVVVRIDADLPDLVRMFTLMDERERAYRGYRKERLIQGSQGQRVINPLVRAMVSFDAEIRQLSDRFGLTPKARLQLGIDMGRARKGLEDVNAELDNDEDEADDPRAALVVAGENEGRPASS